jgi:hypothetical protein
LRDFPRDSAIAEFGSPDQPGGARFISERFDQLLHALPGFDSVAEMCDQLVGHFELFQRPEPGLADDPLDEPGCFVDVIALPPQIPGLLLREREGIHLPETEGQAIRTGQRLIVDTHDRAFRARFEEAVARLLAERHPADRRPCARARSENC